MAKVDHIGIGVKQADGLLNVLDDLLDAKCYKRETVPSDRITTYFVSGGDARIEIIEPHGAGSPLQRFLERRGDGLHHLAFEVDDIDAAMARARSRGYEPLDPEPRPGADGKYIFFLHPKQTAGVLIELCQSRSSVLGAETGSPWGRSRAAGLPEAPGFAYLHDGYPLIDQDALARKLEQCFHFRSIGIGPNIGAFPPGEENEIPLHLAAEGVLAAKLASTRWEATSVPDSLLLVNPSAGSPGPTIDAQSVLVGERTSVFILAVGEGAVRPALHWHDMIAGSRFAALPDDRLAPQVIVSQTRSGRDRVKGPTE